MHGTQAPQGSPRELKREVGQEAISLVFADDVFLQATGERMEEGDYSHLEEPASVKTRVTAGLMWAPGPGQRGRLRPRPRSGRPRAARGG